jgi:hypothetical protein
MDGVNVKKDKRSETNKPRFCLQKGTLGDCIYITLHDYACVQLWLWHDSWSSKLAPPIPTTHLVWPHASKQAPWPRISCNICWPLRWVVILRLFSSLCVDFISFKILFLHLFKNLWWRHSLSPFGLFLHNKCFHHPFCRLQICGPTNLNAFLSQTSTTPPLLPLLLPPTPLK